MDYHRLVTEETDNTEVDYKTLIQFLQARGVEFKIDEDGDLALDGYVDLAADYLDQIKEQKSQIIAAISSPPEAEDQYTDPIGDVDIRAKTEEDFWHDGWYELVTSAQQVLGYKYAELPYDRQPRVFPERDYWVREMNIAHAERNRDKWRIAFDAWVTCQSEAITRIAGGEALKTWDRYQEARRKYGRVVAEIAEIYVIVPAQQRPPPAQPQVLAAERRINDAMFAGDMAALETALQDLRCEWKALGLPLLNAQKRSPRIALP